MMDTFDLGGVEIFRTGKWNGDTYTEADFDSMVEAFGKIGDKIKPYMKLGHAKSQKLLQSDGLPAAGWIRKLWRDGERLMADIGGVPRKIRDLIDAKAY